MASVRTGADSATDVVLALSLETWDDMVRREFARPPDRMTRHLLGDARVGKLIVANPWRSVASVVTRRVGPSRDAAFPTNERASLVRPLRLRRGDSTHLREVERSYRRYSHVIGQQVHRRVMTSPVLITFSPIVAGFGNHAAFRSVTYVARDDWAAADRHAEHKHIYLESYERIRQRRIRVSAVSSVLLNRLSPLAEHIVTPNGVDPETWLDLPQRPPELQDVSGPLIVYTGTVDDRLCEQSLASIVSACPNATLVFVGPRHPAVQQRIARIVPRSSFFGPVGQSALAGFVAAADVCVVPHVRSGLTEAMSPLKLYEYVAAGKRVVATDLEPMRDISGAVTLVATPAEFGPAVADALRRPVGGEPARLAFIVANAWETRCGRILDLALA